jgi:hypothetical protein
MAKKQKSKNKDRGFGDEREKLEPVSKSSLKIPDRKKIKATRRYLKRELKDGSHAHKKALPVSHYDATTLIMIPFVYNFVLQYLRADERDLLYKKAKKAGVKLSATLNKNPFNVGLSLLVSEKKLTPQDRSKYAIQMAYAYRHDVKSVWLIAFLLRSGGDAKIKKKFKEGKFEPWLKTRPKYPLDKKPPSIQKPNEGTASLWD